MSERITIKSHRGEYFVVFDEEALPRLNQKDLSAYFFIIDKKVAELYKNVITNIITTEKTLILEANEENKSLEKFPRYIEHLIDRKVRRNHTLVAIGGGVIQDITSFLAATFMRGLRWHFYPTTLLAQADSCIGSKSSINVGTIKNILGTFTPPNEIHISLAFLKTLEEREMRSGVGEMLKVHAIDSPESFDKIANDYESLFSDLSIMKTYIYSSLMIKKEIIELDEFDKGPRNIMNYGHTFGHAIESATDFAIPHGIAVSMGMDMANFVTHKLGLTEFSIYKRMHHILKKNFFLYNKMKIDNEKFFFAISKDKKIVEDKIKFIGPDKKGKIKQYFYPDNVFFKAICTEYLESERIS